MIRSLPFRSPTGNSPDAECATCTHCELPDCKCEPCCVSGCEGFRELGICFCMDCHVEVCDTFADHYPTASPVILGAQDGVLRVNYGGEKIAVPEWDGAFCVIGFTFAEVE